MPLLWGGDNLLVQSLLCFSVVGDGGAYRCATAALRAITVEAYLVT